jgi:hypothetical protein
MKKHIGLAEREIPVLVYGYYVFQNPPYMASRQLLIPRIAAVGTSRAKPGTATGLPAPTVWR